MAKKTPDYTRQARQKKRRPVQAQRSVGGRSWATWAGYVTLLFSAAMSVYGLAISIPDVAAPGIDGNRAIIAVVAFVACILTAGCVGLLLLHADDPDRLPLKDSDYRRLVYATIFIGLIAALMVLSAHVNIAVLFMALVPTLLVVTLVLRPRMKEREASLEPAAAAAGGGGTRLRRPGRGGTTRRKASSGARRPPGVRSGGSGASRRKGSSGKGRAT